MSSKKSKVDLEWERRILCSDEACIGTIGPDGKCRECGMRYKGRLPEGFDQTIADDDADSSEIAPPAEPEDTQAPDDAKDDDTVDSDDEWAQRKLCSDESCIGVIGPDGLCKECGKPFEK